MAQVFILLRNDVAAKLWHPQKCGSNSKKNLVVFQIPPQELCKYYYLSFNGIYSVTIPFYTNVLITVLYSNYLYAIKDLPADGKLVDILSNFSWCCSFAFPTCSDFPSASPAFFIIWLPYSQCYFNFTLRAL